MAIDDDSWVRIPTPDGDWNAFKDGQRIIISRVSLTQGGRIGVVVGWGADRERKAAADKTGDMSALVDSEGPLVKYDDQPETDSSLDWFPGQAMSVLVPLH